LPAMTLFKRKSRSFRRAFFVENNLWSVANFSNLAEVLFAGRSRVPAAAIFFTAPSSDSEIDSKQESVEVYSPLVANAVSHSAGRKKTRRETWNLVVDSAEIRDIPYRQVEDGDSLPFKLAAWGSAADRKILESLARQFPSIGELENNGRLVTSQGLELRTEDAKEAIERHPALSGRPVLNMKVLRGRRHVFAFPADAFQVIPNAGAYVREGRHETPERVCRPPHIIISVARTFAVFSDQFVAIPHPQVGLAGNKGDEPFLKALALFLNSSFATYHQFLLSPQAGVKREIATLSELRRLPIPLAEAQPSELRNWVDLHTRLVTSSNQPFSNESAKLRAALIIELNEMANDALRLNELQRARIEDFAAVKLELKDGKTGRAAVRAPSNGDLEAYADMLRSQLDAFLGDSESMWHRIAVTPGAEHGVVEIDLEEGKRPDQPVSVNSSSSAVPEVLSLPSILLQQRSQWLYFQRNLRIYEGTKTYLFKPMQRFHWTRTQAAEDAANVIAETLASESE